MEGSASKGARIQWEELGYTACGKHTHATMVGGAVDQQRLLVVRVGELLQTEGWQWPESLRTLPVRPMANLLCSPAFVPRKVQCPVAQMGDMEQVPEVDTDSMPSHPSSWIRTDAGVHHVLGDELAPGLGVPKHWCADKAHLTGAPLHQTTSVFHWECLTPTLLQVASNGNSIKASTTKDSL